MNTRLVLRAPQQLRQRLQEGGVQEARRGGCVAKRDHPRAAKLWEEARRLAHHAAGHAPAAATAAGQGGRRAGAQLSHSLAEQPPLCARTALPLFQRRYRQHRRRQRIRTLRVEGEVAREGEHEARAPGQRVSLGQIQLRKGHQQHAL